MRDADTILRFNSFSNDSFAGKPVGVRWLGTRGLSPHGDCPQNLSGGSVVFFGFPFYYMKETEVRPVAIKVLTDLGEPYGIEESAKSQVEMTKPLPTVVRNTLNLQSAIYNLQSEITLFSIDGRKVLDLNPGANDVRGLSPGVYFVRPASGVEHDASRVTKVVVTR